MVKACSLSYFITCRCKQTIYGNLHFSTYQHTHKKAFHNPRLHLTVPFHFGGQHPLMKHHPINHQYKGSSRTWSTNTTQNQSNSWTCQISFELGTFPFRLDHQPICLTHLHSELCLSTTTPVGLTPNTLREWGRCAHSEFKVCGAAPKHKVFFWSGFVLSDDLESETRKPRKENYPEL